jgi:hypothetical protein
MTDQAGDYAAYIGALAWMPQIIGWIWKAASRSKLRVRAGGNVQVGLSGLGGIVAVNVAVSCDRKDALIDDVRAVVTHEQGDSREFSWNMARENQTEMTNDSGERVQMSRTQAVLALKVTTQTMAERFIGFDVAADKAAILASQNAAKNAWAAQKANGAVDWSKFAQEPEAQAVRVELERAFHWQEGQYKLALVFSIVGGGDHVERLEFNLSKADVDRIKANLKNWDQNLQAVIGGGRWPEWDWCFATLVRR